MRNRIWKVFKRARYGNTRGHILKLNIPICHSESKRRFLGARCVLEWNSLSNEAVEAGSLASFKRLLDRDLGSKLFSVL